MSAKLRTQSLFCRRIGSSARTAVTARSRTIFRIGAGRSGLASQSFVQPLTERSLDGLSPISQVLTINLLGIGEMTGQREVQGLSRPSGGDGRFRRALGREHFLTQPFRLSKSLLLDESCNQFLTRDVVLWLTSRKVQQHRPPRVIGVRAASQLQLSDECRLAFDVSQRAT